VSIVIDDMRGRNKTYKFKININPVPETVPVLVSVQKKVTTNPEVNQTVTPDVV
jgi:hypothetical protein